MGPPSSSQTNRLISVLYASDRLSIFFKNHFLFFDFCLESVSYSICIKTFFKIVSEKSAFSWREKSGVGSPADCSMKTSFCLARSQSAADSPAGRRPLCGAATRTKLNVDELLVKINPDHRCGCLESFQSYSGGHVSGPNVLLNAQASFLLYIYILLVFNLLYLAPPP